MTKKLWPILKEIEHNWSLNGPGAWSTVTWLVFHDGSYKVVSTFNPIIDDREEVNKSLKRRKRPEPAMVKSAGIMDENRFIRLREALIDEPWRDTALNEHACDGVAWEIKPCNADGRIEKSSGKLDCIYGYRVL